MNVAGCSTALRRRSAAEILGAARLSACARSVGLVVVPVRLLPVRVAQ